MTEDCDLVGHGWEGQQDACGYGRDHPSETVVVTFNGHVIEVCCRHAVTALGLPFGEALCN